MAGAAHPLPPDRKNVPSGPGYAVGILLVIALVAVGIGILFVQYGSAGQPAVIHPIVPETTPTPVSTTSPSVVTHAPEVTPELQPPVPQDGVYIVIHSASDYIGQAGNLGQLRQVSGTGYTVYKVPRADRPVQVSVQKRDNTGAVLTAGIYRNGTLISSQSVTKPMGSVALLVDPVTGLAPGLSGNDTTSGYAGNPVGRVENY